jgi:hypothetical protein
MSKAEMVRVIHAKPSFAELFMTHLLSAEQPGRGRSG